MDVPADNALDRARLASPASSLSKEPMKLTAFFTLSFAQAENDQYGRPNARRAALKWVLTNRAVV